MAIHSDCLSDSQLERIAAEPDVGGGAGVHVEGCAQCRERLAQIQANLDFLRGFSGALNRTHLPAARKVDGDDRPFARHPPQLFGDSLPGYTLVRELKRGRQGIVYCAVQAATKRDVAIKLLLPGVVSSTSDLGRFERELELAAGLRHANIVTVHGGGMSTGGRPFLVMEFIRGVSLEEWLRRDDAAAAEPTSVLELFAKIADGVNHAHQRGIIHRDLKPANIMIDHAGEPRVLDFGLAKPAQQTGDAARATHEHAFVGTPMYSAPEQLPGEQYGVDIRTDVYALGVVLFEMLTRRMPYPASDSVWTIFRHIRDTPPPRPSTHNRRIDTDLDTIVLKALSKDKDRRYSTAGALAEDIRRYMRGDAVDARRDSATYLMLNMARRLRVPLSAAALAVVALIVVTLMTLRDKAEILLQKQAAQAAHSRAEAARNAAEAARVESEWRRHLTDIDLARTMGVAGSVALAEDILWREYLTPPPAPNDSTDPWLARMDAYWALWELYARHPCIATLYAGAVQKLFVMDDDETVWSFDQDAAMLSWRLDGSNVIRTGERPPMAGSLVHWRGMGDGFVRLGDDGSLDYSRCAAQYAPLSFERQLPTSVACQPWGSTIAVGAPCGAVVLRDVFGGERVVQAGDAEMLVTMLSFSRDGTRLACATRPLCVNVIDISTGRRVASVNIPQSAPPGPRTLHISYMDQSATGGFLAVGCTGGGVGVFDLAGQLAPQWIGVGTDTMSVVEFHPNSKVVLSAGGDAYYVNLSSFANEVSTRRFGGHRSSVVAARFLRRGQLFVSASKDGALKWWQTPASVESNVRTRRARGMVSDEQWQPLVLGCRRPLVGHGETVNSVAVEPRGRWLASSSGDGTACLWSATEGGLLKILTGHAGVVHTVAIHPDGDTLATAGDDGTIRLWDAASGACRAVLTRHVQRAHSLAFSPDGKWLAAGTNVNIVILMDARSGECVNWASGRAPNMAYAGFSSLAFSADSKTFVTSCRDGRLQYWNVPDLTCHTVPNAHAGKMRSVCMHPARDLAASCGDDQLIRLWDTKTRTCIAELRGHQSRVFCVAFSPEGGMLASGDSDGYIKLWHVDSGRCLVTLPAHELGVFSVAFAPDGRALYSGGCDQQVAAWDLTFYDQHIAGNLDYQAMLLRDAR